MAPEAAVAASGSVAGAPRCPNQQLQRLGALQERSMAGSGDEAAKRTKPSTEVFGIVAGASQEHPVAGS